MIRPEEITDVAQLRQVALLLQAENARLHERLATVVAQLAALQGKSPPEQLQLELTKLQEQMAAYSTHRDRSFQLIVTA